MKAVPFTVPHLTKEAFRYQVDHLPHFYDKLHQHSEVQIMLIIQGEGTLIAGDYVGRFGPGYVYLIGSGQPHVFRCDATYYQSDKPKAHAVSVYFDEKYAGEEFWQLEEMKDIRHFLFNAGKGYKLVGPDRDEAEKILIGLNKQYGLEKFIRFLLLLKIFASSKNTIDLGFAGNRKTYSPTEEKRMNDILQYTFQNSHRKISLNEIAGIANLSSEAFCRYFKIRTRKTYTDFVNEVRISNACKLLISGGLAIEQVAYEAGFNNMSNFNRTFKRITGKTPSHYLRSSP